MTTRSNERKTFLHDVFVTALEGGIGYWSQASAYHWSAEDGSCDLDGFYAEVYDVEANDGVARRIDADVIAHGISLISQAKAPYYDPNGFGTQCAPVEYLGKYEADMIRNASHSNDGGEIDSSLADVIVQVGLFGKVVYG